MINKCIKLKTESSERQSINLVAINNLLPNEPVELSPQATLIYCNLGELPPPSYFEVTQGQNKC